MKLKLILTICAGVGVIVVLAVLGSKQEQKNGFKRPLEIVRLQLQHTLYFKGSKVKYICGQTGQHIYLQTDNPARLLITNNTLSSVHNITLPVDLTADLLFSGHIMVFVDSPSVWIFAGNKPVILTGQINNSNFKSLPVPTRFSRACIACPGFIYLRAFDSTKRNQNFFRYSTARQMYDRAYYESTVNNDGGLTADGLLNVDKSTNTLVYTHFYNNSVQVFDTALKSLRTFKTIDTFSVYQNSTARLKNSFTFSKPKHTLQAYSAVTDGTLYICSILKADNQSEADYRENATIDSYDIETGHYLRSYYVPRINGERFRSFTVQDGELIALYSNFLAAYSLN